MTNEERDGEGEMGRERWGGREERKRGREEIKIK
jgi:hypothetical protein